MLPRERKIVKIRNDDKDRRVYKLQITKDISSLPPSIGLLQDLKEIDLVATFFDGRKNIPKDEGGPEQTVLTKVLLQTTIVKV